MELVGRILVHLDAGDVVEGFREPLRRGSAAGWVSIEPDPEDPRQLLLVVRLEIMEPPSAADSVRGLHRRLLELNHGFRGRAAFSVDDAGTVFLTAGRPLMDLDPGEVVDLILWTSEQADHHDDRLLEEFGGGAPSPPGSPAGPR